MNNNNEITMYTVSEVQQILRCSRTQIYKIVHASGFPKLLLGKKILVEKSALEKWLNNNKGKAIYI